MARNGAVRKWNVQEIKKTIVPRLFIFLKGSLLKHVMQIMLINS